MMKLSGKIGKFVGGVVIGALTVGGVAVAKPGVTKDRKTVPEDATKPPSSSNYYVMAAVWSISTLPDPTKLLYYIEVFGSGSVNPMASVSATVNQSQCSPASMSGNGAGTVYVGTLHGSSFIAGVSVLTPASTKATAVGIEATATCDPVAL